MAISNIYNSINSFINRLGRPTVSDPLGILTEEDKLRIADEAQRRNLLSQGALLMSLGQPQVGTPQRDIIGAVNTLTQGDNYVQSAYNQALQNEMNKMALEDLKAKRGASAEVDERIKKQFQTQPKSIIDDALQLQPQQDTGLGLRMGDAMMQPDNVVQTPEDFIDANIRLTDPSLTDPVGLTMPQVDPLSATDINTMFPSEVLTRPIADLPKPLTLSEPEMGIVPSYDAGFGAVENELTGEYTPADIMQQGLQIPKLADIRQIETPQDAPITLEGLMALRSDPTLSSAGQQYLSTLIDYKQKERDVYDANIKRTQDQVLFDINTRKALKELYQFNDQESEIARRLYPNKFDFNTFEVNQIKDFSRDFESRPNFKILDADGNEINTATMPDSGNVLVAKKDFGAFLKAQNNPYSQPVPFSYANKKQLLSTINKIQEQNLDINLGKGGVNITNVIGRETDIQDAVTKETQKDILSYEQTLKSIQGIEQSLKQDYNATNLKNKVENTINSTLAYVGFELDPNDQEKLANYKVLISQLQSMLSNYLKAQSGAQVAEGEAQRLRSVIPNEKDDPITIRAKLANFKAITLVNKIKREELLNKGQFADYYMENPNYNKPFSDGSIDKRQFVSKNPDMDLNFGKNILNAMSKKRQEYYAIYNAFADQQQTAMQDQGMGEKEFYEKYGDDLSKQLSNWSKSLSTLQKQVLTYPATVKEFRKKQKEFDIQLDYTDKVFNYFRGIYQ